MFAGRGKALGRQVYERCFTGRTEETFCVPLGGLFALGRRDRSSCSTFVFHLEDCLPWEGETGLHVQLRHFLLSCVTFNSIVCPCDLVLLEYAEQQWLLLLRLLCDLRYSHNELV